MSKTILVVEDDKTVQRMLTEALEAEGFTVIAEKDGDWAVRTFEAKEVDFIILDILIPVMNGFQVAERIRKMPRGQSVPILMISGIYRGVNHRQEAMRKYGVVDYLDKPLRLPQVFDCLKATFGAAYPSPVAAEAEKQAIDAKAPEPYASPESHQETAEVEQRASEVSAAAEIHGNLSDTSFPELLARLYRDKADGALLLQRGKVKKIVYFKGGYPVFVKSNLLNECLGKVMVREKMISEEECEESIRRMKQSSRQQGTVLIEMGCISPHNLQYALELQLRTKLLDLFAWEEGEYRYNPKSSLPPTTVTLDSSTAALIYAGIREKIPLARLQQLLASCSDAYVVPHPDPLFRFQDMELDADGEAFVGRLKGKHTVREILDLGLDKERAYQILYALRCAGMILFEDAPPATEEAEETPEEPEPTQKRERPRAARPPAAGPPPPPPPARPSQPPPIREKVKGRLAECGGVPVPEISESPRSAINLSPEDRDLREKLVRRIMEMRKQDYFDILGVSKNAPVSEIKKAYFSLAKQYHPDRIAVSSTAEIRTLADEIFSLLSTANEVLTDEERRAQYLEELSSGAKRGVSSEVSKILSAEGLFQKGEMALRRRDYGQALQLFEEAVRLCPEEGEFHAYLGWTMFQNDPKNEEVVRRARDALNQAVALNPKVDKAYLFLGYIYKAMNYKEMAEHEFEKAIQCNPDCTEALRELRLLNLRKKESKKKGGLFKRG